MEEKALVKTTKSSLSALLFTLLVCSFSVALSLGLVIIGLRGGGVDISYFLRDVFIIGIIIFIILAIIGTLLHKSELTITNKRAYGTAAFGKRVDLPLDSISAVATGIFNRLSIATSSGRITFWGIQNLNEFHNVLSALIIERQSKPAGTTTIKQEIPQSNADELKKYKGLLDDGVITQEEFDAKKKQLLGL